MSIISKVNFKLIKSNLNFLSFPIWCGIVIEQPWPECHFISPLSKQKMSIIYGKKYSFECKLQEVYSSLAVCSALPDCKNHNKDGWPISKFLMNKEIAHFCLTTYPWAISLFINLHIASRRAEFGSSPRFTFDFSPQKLTSEKEEKKERSDIKKNFPISGKFLNNICVCFYQISFDVPGEA